MRDKTGNQKSITVLGNPGAGKTTLLHSLSGRNFLNEESSTHAIKEFIFEKDLGVSFIDFGGQTNSEEIIEQIDKQKPLIVLIVIDSRNERFESTLEEWISILDNYSSRHSLKKILVASRCDVNNIVIDEASINRKYSFEGIFKTSSKDGIGIHELRSSIRSLITDLNEDYEEESDGISVVISLMLEKLCELIAKNPSNLERIEWRDLERLIANILENLGFNITLTPSSKDGGKDVIAICTIEGKEKKFYVEIKHWRQGGRPGDKCVSEFVQVNACDKTDGGLFLSSSGFSNSLYSKLAELTKQNVRLGDKKKIISLCQKYVLKKNGVWYSNNPLPELLFEHTLN